MPVIYAEFGAWVETVSGRRLDLHKPAPAAITIDDIAWALSRLYRFAGHTCQPSPYSVAEHCVWVADYLYLRSGDAELALHGLLHDAHEAYLGDVIRPVRLASPVLQQELHALETRVQTAILQAFDLAALTPDSADQVHRADQAALALEVEMLMPSAGAGWALPAVPMLARRLPAPRPSGDQHNSCGAFIAKFHALHHNRGVGTSPVA